MCEDKPPQHEWDMRTFTCRRCLKTHQELMENPLAFACMSDADIASAVKFANRILGK